MAEDFGECLSLAAIFQLHKRKVTGRLWRCPFTTMAVSVLSIKLAMFGDQSNLLDHYMPVDSKTRKKNGNK